MPKINTASVKAYKGTGYPPEFNVMSAERLRQRLGDVGGITDFGVNLTRLPPENWSSQRHWHSHEDELKALFAALRSPEDAPVSLSPGMALCLQLCAFTLQRAGEVAGIRRDEIRWGERLWVLPAARSKNKREHLVPLSDEAMAIIDKAESLAGDSALLFPSPRRGPEQADQPITRHAVTRAMARLMDGLELKRAGPHDLRRTGATWITSERIGLPRFYVSHVLGHVSETGGVTSVYDRNSYLLEKRQALEALSKQYATIS